jgi:hypothetical protein
MRYHCIYPFFAIYSLCSLKLEYPLLSALAFADTAYNLSSLRSWTPAIPIVDEFSQTRATTHSTQRALQPDEFTDDIGSYSARYFANPFYQFSLVFDSHPDKRYLQYS